MIYLIDYGAGNLKSAWHAFCSYSPGTQLIQRADQIGADASGLVLPGDGSFPVSYSELTSRGFTSFLQRNRQLPLMGICVGFQLLFTSSTEDGGSEGLNFIQGEVKRFDNSLSPADKIPHMGWNRAKIHKESPLTQGVEDGDWFYFVHSYRPEIAAAEKSSVLLTADYLGEFCCAVTKDKLYGTQFHPEKSHRQGRRMVENFVRICEGKI